PLLKSKEKTPSGMPVSRAASQIAVPAISATPGCEKCAFTTTGHPEASAEAVSPPATENASGKLLAQKIATGPSGNSIDRTSGFGNGWREGSAVSTRASTHQPSSTIAAKKRNCVAVRPRSIRTRASGKADSAITRVARLSPNASRLAAICRRNAARRWRGKARYTGNAEPASPIAASSSLSVAEWYGGSNGSPVAAVTPRKVSLVL